MRKIISKFQCNSLIAANDNYPTLARLNAVYANSDGTTNQENASFSEATPNGNIDISISKNAPAHKFFTNGRYYYLTFELIPMTDSEIAYAEIAKLPPEEQSAAYSAYYKSLE